MRLDSGLGAIPRQVSIGPCVRAQTVRDTLGAAERFEPGLHDRILLSMPDEARRAVMKTPSLGWIAIRHDRYVARGLVDGLGDERLHRFFSRYVPQQVHSSRLRGLVAAGKRMLGANPGSLVWATERLWDLVFRDFGVVHVLDIRSDWAALELRQLHPNVLDEPAYLKTFEAIFDGYFAVVDTPGTLDYSVDHEAKTIRAHWRW